MFQSLPCYNSYFSSEDDDTRSPSGYHSAEDDDTRSPSGYHSAEDGDTRSPSGYHSAEDDTRPPSPPPLEKPHTGAVVSGEQWGMPVGDHCFYCGGMLQRMQPLK